MTGRVRMLGLVVVLALGFALPASAHLSLTHCPSGALCVWEHPDGGGAQFNFFFTNNDWSTTANAAITNKDSSWANDSNQGNEVSVYSLPNHVVRTVCLNPQTTSNNWQAWGDRGESNLWGTSNC